MVAMGREKKPPAWPQKNRDRWLLVLIGPPGWLVLLVAGIWQGLEAIEPP